MLTEVSNKRKHSIISKRSKYAEVNSDEDEDESQHDDFDNECQY